MKKVISLMLAATMMFGICACANTPSTEPTASTSDTIATSGTTGTTGTTGTKGTTGTTVNPLLAPDSEGFDEQNIVLQFGAVSDVHVAYTSGAPGRVQNALQQLKDAALLYTDKGLDAVVVAGDLTDDYGSNQATKATEIQSLKKVYETVFGATPTVPMIYGLGNHDHDFERNGGAGSDLATFINVMGNKDVHTKYDVECSDAAHGSRHSVIGNYHFLFLEPITYGCTGADDTGAKYYAETKAWLDAELKAITEANPNSYVFVVTHPMIYGTVYGSDLLTSGIYWYTKDITDILNKYPQVVTFGGHLHFPLNDERSIMQTGFTSLGCGSVQYMAIEQGNYDGMANPEATVMPDKGSVSSGYLVQVDASGNVRFIRMDFQRKALIKEAFVIEAPKADGSHLKKYSKDRANTNTAPVLADNAITLKPEGTDLITLTVDFVAGTDNDLIHHYVLEAKENGTVLETHNILTDFYLKSKVSDMKTSYSVRIRAPFSPGGKYEITLTAYDSWNAASNTLVSKFEPVLDTTNVTIPGAYADIDFANGTAADKNGKVNVELVGGAKVEEGSYTMAGVNKSLTLAALNVKGEGYAKVVFKDFATADAINDFFKKEYAVEIVYVNRSNIGKQDIFGGYGKKGFGLYEENGVPTFTNKFSKEFKNVAAQSATSKDELVHVIISYSSTTSAFSVYVNGERKAINGGGYSQIGNNTFAIGANYGEGTVGTSAKDLSVVDVKIYDKALGIAQATVRYQNALAEYNK